MTNYLLKELLKTHNHDHVSVLQPSHFLINNGGFYLQNTQNPQAEFSFMFSGEYNFAEQERSVWENMSALNGTVETSDAIYIYHKFNPFSQIERLTPITIVSNTEQLTAIHKIDKATIAGLMPHNQPSGQAIIALLAIAPLLILILLKRNSVAQSAYQYHLKMLFQSSPHPIIETNANQEIIHLNHAACVMLGQSEMALNGQQLLRYLPAQQHDTLLLQTLCEEDQAKVNTLETELLVTPHKPIMLAQTSYLTQNNDCNSIYFLVDLTEQKTREAQLDAAREIAENANDAREKFLANMSHEMRTPLNAILGFINLMKTSSLNKRQRSFINKQEYAAKTLLELVNNVLDIAKIDSGELKLITKPVNVRQEINQIFELLSVISIDKPISFVQGSWPDEIPEVLLGDELRIRQILFNIINNAIKFTHQGSVELKIHAIPAHREGYQRIMLAIKDSGIGIPKEQQKKIFDRFQQIDDGHNKSFQGTGLGLPICRELVERMNGQIYVESEYGRGSTFYIEIELAETDEQLSSEINTKLSLVENIKDKHILVVDDNEINLDVITHLLENEGLSIATAKSARDAIDYLLEQPKAVDIVFMDIQMPVMNGYEATKFIRKQAHLRDIPIVALSAGIMSEERERAIMEGMNDFVAKPFDLAKILQAIDYYTNRE